MPQQFQAVKCYKCNTFQVQQVKKVQKFNCAICGEKQTVQHIYAISDAAKDIRLHVQRLNMGAAAAQGAQEDAALQRLENVHTLGHTGHGVPTSLYVDTVQAKPAAVDWMAFADDGDDTGLDCGDDNGCERLVTTLPDGKRGRGSRGCQSRPYKQRRMEESSSARQPNKGNASGITVQAPKQDQPHLQHSRLNYAGPAQRVYGSSRQPAQPQNSTFPASRPINRPDNSQVPEGAAVGLAPGPQPKLFRLTFHRRDSYSKQQKQQQAASLYNRRCDRRTSAVGNSTQPGTWRLLPSGRGWTMEMETMPLEKIALSPACKCSRQAANAPARMLVLIVSWAGGPTTLVVAPGQSLLKAPPLIRDNAPSPSSVKAQEKSSWFDSHSNPHGFHSLGVPDRWLDAKLRIQNSCGQMSKAAGLKPWEYRTGSTPDRLSKRRLKGLQDRLSPVSPKASESLASIAKLNNLHFL
ncbi:hypothetical protein VOLCADRAFT_88033 [Volvox carteri f. nagariensis]|uniref:MRN complex-interacting protein N-terminal domain-containing protein n=1 Tax=Volvox carteri f. nagariensis TaxID=3068 RepID=D8TMW5_VOLCA|nr:uncharacterized protein VOLCADRAFT_88033 [Volvox carteri f. nagariensis]EFJ51200.1 hypothetical protein VOLCADRAFT_88033 [Volvox carteri f. nagariensis]|eukprot:XP_002947667.1 hypothetical protein VOLCADRAFT_88033 [Volvox carteri f. nagariensis]